MKNKIATTILLNSIFITFIFAQQQYPNLWNVGIRASSFQSRSEQMFYYLYTLTNNISNKGEISGFEIDISRTLNSCEIDTIGLKFENDGFTEKDFRDNFPHLKDRIIPVGFYNTPAGKKWIGGLTDYLTADFAGFGENHILPGQSLYGFEMMSKGLPSIRRCIVSPFFDEIALFPDPEDTTITYYVPPLDSVRNAVKFYGWTIGPTAPPINFIATVWCDTLTSYTNRSRALGWIKDQATANKYIGYFSFSRTKLVQQDSVGVRTVLLQVLKDVDIDSTANLTSEAYALIRYNTEYLMERLSERK